MLIKLKVHYLKPSEAKKNHPFLHRVGSLFINFKDYYLDVTEAEFLMYRDLANKGIEHYWSRDIVLEQQVWKITTIVEEAIDGIEIILANPGLNNTRSAMPYPFFPGIFIYDSEVEYPDQEFQVTAAHEFGHVILTDAFGLNYSWRHKNTSTLFGNIYQNAPCCPVMGEIDLMQYQHNTYRLCSTDIHQRLIAHEDDVKTLLYISSRL